jgi:hypothetical protein
MMEPNWRALFLFFGLGLWRSEPFETLQQFFLAHVLHGDVGIVGVDRPGCPDQRRVGLGLVDLDIFLQRMNQVFLQIAG